MNVKELAKLGPKVAAEWLHKDGQGQESNPYPSGSPSHRTFQIEMEYCQIKQQQRDDFADLMGFAP